MRRTMFNAKIHRATVTQADLHYEGSVTIDQDLLDAADILEHESIHIWNITRGTRLVTYVLSGERGKGDICINGAAAHLMKPGDMVILATYVELEDAQARAHKPTVIRVDSKNKMVSDAPEIAGPNPPLDIASL
jgi:aspartate 1-decarboxylase